MTSNKPWRPGRPLAAPALAGSAVLAWRRPIDLAVADALVAAVLVTPPIVLYYFVRMALTVDYSSSEQGIPRARE